MTRGHFRHVVAAACLCFLGAAGAHAAEDAPPSISLPSFPADDEIVTLPTVFVSGERDLLLDALSSGVVSVARPDDVKGEHKSIPDLLDQIPGVYVRSQSGSAHYTTASIRGSAPSQVNIYIDGIPLNLSSEMAADISTLPMSGVERVEVYRGTTPARFSGAPVGGAINIVTKKPDAFIGSISAGKRSFHGEQYATTMHFPLLTGHMLIAIDRDASEGDFEYTNNRVKKWNEIAASTGVKPWEDNGIQIPAKRTRTANRVDKENALFKWEDKRFIVKFAWTDLDRMMPEDVRGGTTYNDEYIDLPINPPGYSMPFPYEGNQQQRQVLKKREALAGWRDSFGNLDAAVNLTWLKNRQSYRNGVIMKAKQSGMTHLMGSAWSAYTTERKGVTGDLVWRLNEGGAFTHQLELHTDWYDEALKVDLSNGLEDSFQDQFSRRKRDIQLQDMITVVPIGLQVTPVIRYEKLSGPLIFTNWGSAWPYGKGDLKSKVTGGLSVKKTFESGWQVFGNHGTYIRFPNFYEIYGNGFGIVPGVDSQGSKMPLVPETGRNSDLGFGWQGRLSEEFRGNFRLTHFWRKTDTTISLFSTPIGAQYMNGGPALYKGIEFEGNLAWGSRADLQLAYTRQKAHFTGDISYFTYPSTYESPEKDYPGETIRVLQIPDYVFNARLNTRFFNNRLNAYIEANRVGRVYRSQHGKEEPLTTVNLGGAWLMAKTGPNRGLRISFGVNDVFNKGPEQGPDGGGAILPGSGASYSGKYVPQTYYSPNLGYPNQGRTYYTTLNWSY
jgi:outer membrane receptor protein involved in Fe transport